MALMLELRLIEDEPGVVMHDVVRDRVWVYPREEKVTREGVEALVLGVLKGEREPTPPGTAEREEVEEDDDGDEEGEEGTIEGSNGKGGTGEEKAKGKAKGHDEL